VEPLQNDKTPVAVIRTLMQLGNHEKLVEELSVPGNLTTENGKSSGASYLLYNDEPDNAKPGTAYGHTKGVVAMSGTDGLWIVHSTPKFPSSTGSKQFYFPETETKYGQTFLCIKLTAAEIEDVAKQLLYNKPYVYKSTFSSSIGSTHPQLEKVLNGEWVKEAGSSTLQIGKFTTFAKNAAWNDDLYETAIAAHYKSDLYVETWIRGSAEGSYCKPKYKYEVMDVETMVAQSSDGNITWTEGQDHAKWAVMLDGSSNLCVGDINRMTTQRNRGGGAVCFSSAGLNNALYNSIVTGHVCPK